MSARDAVLAALARLPRPASPTLVAIDGGGGAGKSTLAAALAERLAPSAVVAIDDFYAPATDSERAGRLSRYQSDDWGSECAARTPRAGRNAGPRPRRTTPTTTSRASAPSWWWTEETRSGARRGPRGRGRRAG